MPVEIISLFSEFIAPGGGKEGIAISPPASFFFFYELCWELACSFAPLLVHQSLVWLHIPLVPSLHFSLEYVVV